MTDLLCPDAIEESNSALILAGGAGRRMNGQDKGLLEWHGKPLIDHVLARIRPQVERAYISCNRNRKEYAARAELTPVDLRDDFQGPLAGLEAARTAVQSKYLLVAPCDMPCLPEYLFERLLVALQRNESANVAYATTMHSRHYLCAVLNSRCLASLPRFLNSGERAVHRWYDEIGAIAVNFPNSAGQFANINLLGDAPGFDPQLKGIKKPPR